MARHTLTLAPTLELPRDAVTETLGILGNRGAGKTNTAVVYVEELLKAGMQCVVIDPTDVWWGLASNRAGDGPGFPVVICGGRRAHVPIDEGDGRTIADFIIESGASVVLSLRHLSQNAERRFVTDLCNRLYALKGQHENPTPIAVVFDEAGRIVPQRVEGGVSAVCVGAVQQLVRQGRSSGFGVVLIDQRPATVNKEVLELLEMMIVHRVTGPLNRKTLRGWVESQASNEDGRGETFLESLPMLQKGEAWVWSPGWLDIFKRVTMRERETFDSSYTPRPGEKRITPTKVAKVDLDALKAKLAVSIERARADDPKLLRQRIAELEAANSLRTNTPETDDAAVKKVAHEEYQRGFGDGQVSAYKSVAARVVGSDDAITGAINSIESMLAVLAEQRDRIADARHYVEDTSRWPGTPVVAARHVIERPIVVGSVRGAVDSTVREYERAGSDTQRRPVERGDMRTRFGEAFAFFRQFGIEEPRREQFAAYLEYHPRSKSFVDTIKELSSTGALSVGTGVLIPSDKLVRSAKLPPDDVVKSLDKLHIVWLRKLGTDTTDAKMLAAVIAKRRVARDALAAMLGYHPRSKSFVDGIGRLKVLGLVTSGGGSVDASDILFPSSLR